MEQSKIFITLWDNLRGEMEQEINFQIENHNCVNFNKLNELYKTKLTRWSSMMTHEGAWISGLENETLRQEILEAIDISALEDEETQTDGSNNILIVGVASGVVTGGASLLFKAPAVVNAVSFAAGCAAGCLVMKNKKNARLERELEAKKVFYLKQIDNDGKRIADIFVEAENNV